MGGFIAYQKGQFSISIFVLALLTTICLQILSNLANDYGDSQNGADNENRIGPLRAVQSGKVSIAEIKLAIYFFVSLSLILGISLLFVSFDGFTFLFFLFLIIGILAILAAYFYTAGSKPYGYAGLGDVSVFMFFGIVGVCGSVFLFTKTFDWFTIFPAITLGCFSVAVLNLNNMRDIDSDLIAGKNTIPVRIGYVASKYYHTALIFSAFIAAIIAHLSLVGFGKTMYFLIFIIPFVLDLKYILQSQKGEKIDHLLKKTALLTLGFVMLFGFGICF